MQRSNLDSFLITLMLGLFLFSGFKLFLEDQNPFLVTGSDFLAEIAYLENTVKNKSGTHLAWNDARDAQKLFDGDQLYTHENSEVDILFRDKTKINILENSLFKLERKDLDPIIVLKEGIFYIRTRGVNKKIKVKVANRELSIDSVESKLQVQGQGLDSKVIVLEGSAKINIGDQELLLKPNQFIELKESKKLDVKLIPIKLLQPLHNTTLFHQERIEFTWDLSTKKTAVFQLSDDPSFKNVLIKEALIENTFSMNNLSKGAYYWRVLEDDSSEAFEIRKLIILEPIHIIGPLYSSLIRMKKPDSPVYFNWEGETFDSFYIEVSKDKDFKKTLVSKKIDTHKFIWDQALPGQYFWRIKKANGDNQIFTNPFPFQIRREMPLAPPSIEKIKKTYKLELKKKSSKNSFSLIDLFINKAAADDFVKQTTLEWPLNKNAKSYIIEVYSDSNLKNLIFKKSLEQNSFTWVSPPVGKFYWRLALVDYWEQASEFSQVIHAEVLAPKPIAKKKRVVKKIKEAPKAPTPRQIQTEQEKQTYFSKIKTLKTNYLRFINSPSFVKFNSEKGIININSSGSSLASFEVESRIKRKDKDFYQFNLSRLTGDAFTDTAYTNMKARIAFGRYFHLGQTSPLYYKLGLLGTSSTYYLREGIDQLVENKNTSFALNASLGGERPSFFSLTQHYQLKLGLGTNLSLEALYDLHYKFNSKYTFTLGGSGAYERFSTSDDVLVSFLNLNFRFSALYYF